MRKIMEPIPEEIKASKSLIRICVIMLFIQCKLHGCMYIRLTVAIFNFNIIPEVLLDALRYILSEIST